MTKVSRDYIRHPCSIPITLLPHHEFVPRQTDSSESRLQQSPWRGRGRNVSRGGLCCLAERSFRRGDALRVCIDAVQPPFRTRAQVIWCEQIGTDLYEVGFSFLSAEDAYAARMVEQICHIEAYRMEVLEKEHRRLSSEEAALEWIDRYASDFPPGLYH